jgi:hypothetical protein
VVDVRDTPAEAVDNIYQGCFSILTYWRAPLAPILGLGTVRGENFVAVSPHRCSEQVSAALMHGYATFVQKGQQWGEVNHHVR